MARRKVVKEIKQPDVVQSAFKKVFDWIQTNKKNAIIMGVIVIVIGFSAWGYAVYQSSKDEKAQYALSQSIAAYGEYLGTHNPEALTRAEGAFKAVRDTYSGGTADVAKLYLAKIAVIKGQTEEAGKLYGELLKKSADNRLRKLAESALGQMNKKQ
jgi:predicted negative regulator of RcsB-dependent stress response